MYCTDKSLLYLLTECLTLLLKSMHFLSTLKDPHAFPAFARSRMAKIKIYPIFKNAVLSSILDPAASLLH